MVQTQVQTKKIGNYRLASSLLSHSKKNRYWVIKAAKITKIKQKLAGRLM
jgi:hypothetical protein